MELRQSEMDFGDQMMLKVLIEKEIYFCYQFLKNLQCLLMSKLKFPLKINSTGRLDLFALYGPTVNYHSVDHFCHQCIKIAKN